MIIHENVTIQDDVIRFQSIIQQLKKYALIVVIAEYCLALVTPAGYMI
ncbi:MAG: hypothetical protein JETT_2569 [Candidatus Jettenia ecosi]|uniref:Uncharacterized protein n=1 Tax=Candidatus Jettenia ecosi TaxID=2494326 RepID=A0A533QKR0_9BACT|nr:MAG: hypothetical protein JETT_2569 [Candidatus Jettenia ecosi]